MFANDTNLFISNIKVNELFSDINCELKKISFWFKVNKLWLKLTKTKYFLFHPPSKKKKKKKNFERTTTLFENEQYFH